MTSFAEQSREGAVGLMRSSLLWFRSRVLWAASSCRSPASHFCGKHGVGTVSPEPTLRNAARHAMAEFGPTFEQRIFDLPQ